MSGAEKIAISAAIGGTAEALGGGKFANGAVTGAYVMMFNHMMHGDIWHPTRKEVAEATSSRTETTGNEASYLVFNDECGDEYFWEVPADTRDGPTISYLSFPPASETVHLTLKEQYHYSQTRAIVDGQKGWLKGSYADWLVARDLNITVTHHTLGIGVWVFRPSYFFTQPISIVYRQWIELDKQSPIPIPKNRNH